MSEGNCFLRTAEIFKHFFITMQERNDRKGYFLTKQKTARKPKTVLCRYRLAARLFVTRKSIIVLSNSVILLEIRVILQYYII